MKKILMICFAAFLMPVIAAAEEITWKQCVEEALKNSPAVISARERLNQIKAGSWIPASSALPQVSASASGSRSGNEPGPDATPSALGNPSNTYNNGYSYGISARQLLFDGFNNTQQILKAAEDSKAAELNYKIASAQARYDLRQSYTNLMKAQKMVVLTGQIYELRKKQYQDVKLRYNSGTEDKGSMMNSEADMEQAQFESGQSARTLELAKLDLANKLGRDKSADLELKEDFSVVEPYDKDPDFDAIFESNYAKLLATAQMRSAGYSMGSQISSMLPSVYLSGSAGRSGQQLMPENTTWSLGVNMSFSVLDGGKSAALTAESSSSLAQAKSDEKASWQKAYAGIKKAWYDYRDSITGLGVQDKYMQAADIRAKIADAKYTTGLIDFNNWTIIQNSLVSTQKSYVAAQAQILISEAAWVQAKGGTLESDIDTK